MCIITVDTYRKEPGVILETERLALRQFGPDDALFIIDLLNDPDWLTNIGDRDVHSVEQAVAYLEAGPMTMYATYGGSARTSSNERVESRSDWHVRTLQARAFGGCRHRQYALLRAYRGAGYALEAAQGVMRYVRRPFLASNGSLPLLPKRTSVQLDYSKSSGLHFERTIPYGGAKEDVRLFSGTLVHTRDPTS